MRFIMVGLIGAGCMAALTSSECAAAQIAHEAWFPGSSSIAEQEIIPPAYRGNWGSSAAACGDQDGVERMTVYPNGLDTYESGGRLERVTQAGRERSIRLKLAYEGEGRFWDAEEIWTLNEHGDRLTVTASEGPPTLFVRCT
jgi:hypothetical protein